MTDADRRLADTVRIEGARILATLVRTVGDLQVAEDAVQEAVVAALRDWPRSGIPREPRAWLTVAARRKALDILRREQARAGKEREGTELMDLTAPEPSDSVVRDDQLRLLFTCCHPALSLDAQVALALRTLCGLTTGQIAAVLLTTEPAMAKRLTRTRQKITAAAIPYRVPSDAELPDRLPGVCAVVYLLYTSGHSEVSGDDLVDVDVCAEAVRLGRLLHELLPDEPMPAAVLALMLLTEGRRAARFDPTGEVIALEDQDRGHWDGAMLAEGTSLLEQSLRRTARIADPYQLQAAVAAQHAHSPSYRATDWAEIVRLYDLLLTVLPTPAAALSRAVAVAEARGATAGLAELDPLARDDRWHAVRGELLARVDRLDEAVAETRVSLRGDVTGPERRHRLRRIAQWQARTTLPP